MRESLVSKKIAIIGAGRLGRALARALYEKGYVIAAVISRTVASAQRCAQEVNSPLAATKLENIPPDVSTIFIAAPDDAISVVARELAGVGKIGVGCAVLHTSGLHPAEILSPLRRRRASLASMHPMQSFSGAEDDWQRFAGCYFGLEGEEAAVKIAQAIVVNLGGIPVMTPAEGKRYYHLACTVASNYLVILLQAASSMLTAAGFSETEAIKMLTPLIQGTMQNVQSLGVVRALTGPASRGDIQTVAAHLKTLQEKFPSFLPAYEALGRLAVEVGKERGDVSREVMEQMTVLWNRFATGGN